MKLMTQMKTSVAAIALISAALSGCATIFSDSSQVVKIESHPPGAQVYIDGNLVGQTPIEVDLPKKTFHHYQFQLRKDNYSVFTQRIGKQLNDVALFNLTSWPSWGTDALTGAMIEFTPGQYFIELQPRLGHNSQQSFDASVQRLYTATNFEQLKQDIAQGEGQNIAAMGKLYGLNSQQQIQFENILKQDGTALIAIESASDLISAIEKHANSTKI